MVTGLTPKCFQFSNISRSPTVMVLPLREEESYRTSLVKTSTLNCILKFTGGQCSNCKIYDNSSYICQNYYFLDQCNIQVILNSSLIYSISHCSMVVNVWVTIPLPPVIGKIHPEMNKVPPAKAFIFLFVRSCKSKETSISYNSSFKSKSNAPELCLKQMKICIDSYFILLVFNFQASTVSKHLFKIFMAWPKLRI